MLNRLNRNFTFAMCLGGLACLAIGCADAEEASVATATSSESQSQAAEDADQAMAERADVAGEADEADEEAVDAAAALAAARERAEQRAAEHGDRNADSAAAGGNDEDSDGLLFSPSESYETVTAALPESDPVRRQNPASNEPRVEVTPSLLDLGTMSTNETKSGTMTIRNISDQPVMIENSRTSCGCTVANVPRGQYLEPGESVDVDVSLRSSTREQVLTKTVTFLIRDHPPVTTRVRGEVVSYVTIEPGILNPETFSDGAIVIQSEDGEPFRVTSIHPKITAEEPSEESATRHEFTIAWDKWQDMGEARRVIFYTNHPKATQVMATIRAPRRAERDADSDLLRRRGERSQDADSGPNPFSLVLRGEIEQFVELLDAGDVDLNARDRSGQTLLGLAARIGSTEAVDALIEAGLDVDAGDSVGRTPLMTAGQAKNPDIVEQLINAGADLDAKDSTIGGTALAWTAAFGDAASAKLLIDAGADVDMPTDATGFTPLIWAAGFGQTGSVQHLIDAGAELEYTDRTEGATALMHATRTGRADNVKALIKAGADLNATDNSGRTPLLMAAGASGADLEIVKALVEAGADVSTRDRSGLGVLDHARGRQDPNARAIVDYLTSLVGEDAG